MYSSSVSRTRYTGYSSGLDIDSIVQASLTLENSQITKVTQQKLLAELKLQKYRDINASVSTFQSTYLSSASKDTSIYLPSAFKAKSVTMTSNNYFNVTATATAESGVTHNVTSVKVAERAIVQSAKVDVANVTSMTLSDLESAMGITFDRVVDGDGSGGTAGQIKVTANGTAKTFDSTTTVSDFMSQVNSISGLNAKLTYNEINKKFEFKSTDTGNSAHVSFGGAMFGAGSYDIPLTDDGADAEVGIDGETITSSSNTFTVAGLTFTLTQSSSNIDYGMNVDTDVDGIYNRIKTFVDSYNTLIGDLNSQIREEATYKQYPPLTDDQKKEMTDAQISDWDKKTNSGLVHGDSNISDMLSGLRSLFSEDIAGTGMSFFDIGITTGDYKSYGKLVIDEEKLKEAILTNGSKIADMFAKVSSSSDSTTRTKESGLAYRFNSLMQNYINTIKNNTISNFTTSIDNFSNKLDLLNAHLEKKEDILYDKYAQLETLLSQVSSQTTALNNMTGN